MVVLLFWFFSLNYSKYPKYEVRMYLIFNDVIKTVPSWKLSFNLFFLYTKLSNDLETLCSRFVSIYLMNYKTGWIMKCCENCFIVWKPLLLPKQLNSLVGNNRKASISVFSSTPVKSFKQKQKFSSLCQSLCYSIWQHFSWSVSRCRENGSDCEWKLSKH